MNLEIFREIKDGFSKNDIKEFMEELKENLNRKEKDILIPNGIYQVVEFTGKSMFLQNIDTNVVFEEKNIPDDIKTKIGNDYILRYENGKYLFDKELTDKFFNNMFDIKKKSEQSLL